MKKMTKHSLLAFSIIFGGNASALSPPNITADIPWTDTGGVFQLPSTFNASFNGVADIAAAFDNARRQEEIQLGLTMNTLGNLDLPSQVDWDQMTDDAKALLILNEERVDRAGAQTGVIGLPFAGIESHIDNIAKNYGDLLHDTDTTGHNQGGSGPSDRIDQDADIGKDALGAGNDCHEFITRSENLAYFTASSTNPISSIPLSLERAIYNWIYNDSGSWWGHREAVLLQDENLDNVSRGWGFENNHGSMASEGFLGIYVRSSPDYQPFGPSSSPYSYGSVVVMNIFDPVSTPTSCHYNVTLDSSDVRGVQGKAPTLQIPANTWAQIGLNTQPATGSTVTDILGDNVTGAYGTNWAVYRYDNTTNPNNYVQLALTDTMLPGVGYWFIHISEAVTLDMPGSSSGVYVTHTSACASSEGCFEVPLQVNASASQWQMLGYPFRDSRNLDKVRIVTNAGSCSSGCTLTEASDNGVVADTFWHYGGGAYQALANGRVLNPWDGVWVSILPTAGLQPKVLFPETAIASAPVESLSPAELRGKADYVEYGCANSSCHGPDPSLNTKNVLKGSDHVFFMATLARVPEMKAVETRLGNDHRTMLDINDYIASFK